MTWVIWGVVCALTQFFGTLTSRARNTASYSYHGIVASLNHATWFMTQAFLVDSSVKTFTKGDTRGFLVAWGFYTSVSTAASVIAHVFAAKYLEKGDRRIGAYGDHQ